MDGGRNYDNKFYDNQITNTAIGIKLKYSDNIEVTSEVTGGSEADAPRVHRCFVGRCWCDCESPLTSTREHRARFAFSCSGWWRSPVNSVVA